MSSTLPLASYGNTYIDRPLFITLSNLICSRNRSNFCFGSGFVIMSATMLCEAQCDKPIWLVVNQTASCAALLAATYSASVVDKAVVA